MKKRELGRQIDELRQEVEALKVRISLLEALGRSVASPYPMKPIPKPFIVTAEKDDSITVDFDSEDLLQAINRDFVR